MERKRDEEIHYRSKDSKGEKNIEKILQGDDRITKPYATNYERVLLLSVRANQLSRGAKPMIKGLKDMGDHKKIAQLELRNKTLPLVIIRRLPENKVEEWKTSELIFDD